MLERPCGGSRTLYTQHDPGYMLRLSGTIAKCQRDRRRRFYCLTSNISLCVRFLLVDVSIPRICCCNGFMKDPGASSAHKRNCMGD